MRRVLGIAAVLCLGWGGHALIGSVSALELSDDAARQSDNSAITSGQANEARYPDLPIAVARSVQSVVSVQRRTSSNPANNGIVASGVILNSHQILTAGHTTDTGKQTLSCSNTTVVAPGYLTTASASGNRVTYGSAIYGNRTDIAALSVEPDGNFQSLPAVSLASDRSLPKVGETVYFINYQPKADGQTRKLGEPAIFSGTVLGNTPRGLAIATGNGQSYGRDEPEILARKGASGGAVVNAAGELVGLSVSSDSLEANRNADYIMAMYGVSLPKHQYQVTNAQVVDLQHLTQLQSNMAVCN